MFGDRTLKCCMWTPLIDGLGSCEVRWFTGLLSFPARCRAVAAVRAQLLQRCGRSTQRQRSIHQACGRKFAHFAATNHLCQRCRSRRLDATLQYSGNLAAARWRRNSDGLDAISSGSMIRQSLASVLLPASRRALRKTTFIYAAPGLSARNMFNEFDSKASPEDEILPEENDFVQIEGQKEEEIGLANSLKRSRSIGRAPMSQSKPKICTAHYVAEKIDLLRTYNHFFQPFSTRMMNNYLLVVSPDRCFDEHQAKENRVPSAGAEKDPVPVESSAFLSSVRDGITGKYLVVFSYGSVVFFNMPKQEQEFHLDRIQLYGQNLMNPMVQHFEEELIYKEIPDLKSVGLLHNGDVLVRSLDISSVSIISSVIGLTVALEYYENNTDQMMQYFRLLNNSLRDKKWFDTKLLHRLMARQNHILVEVSDHLALIDRSDITWESPEYDELWDGLRVDYELIQRFSKVEWRLNMMQRNTKFFLEIMHHEVSKNLEWTIIALISVEILISLFNISHKFN